MSGDEESQKRIQFLRGRITILETRRSTPEETIRVKQGYRVNAGAANHNYVYDGSN